MPHYTGYATMVDMNANSRCFHDLIRWMSYPDVGSHMSRGAVDLTAVYKAPEAVCRAKLTITCESIDRNKHL